MNTIQITFLKILRKIYKTVFEIPKGNVHFDFDFEGQPASDKIKELLLSPGPVMISRLGLIEIECITKYYNRWNNKWKFFKYIRREISEYWYTKETYELISQHAGVFCPTKKVLDDFSELYLNDMKEIDILGVLTFREEIFKNELKHAIKIPLGDIEPYYHVNPWSSVLENKTVLVIHPFKTSIDFQYKKRKLLFKDERILPNFNLITLKSVQSIAGNQPEGFNTWFEALNFMKNQISKIEFDIAIIGCGAYGLPLAAFVKRMGKKAIHLGGQTQIMFGIKGKRWEDREFFLNMFNEDWIRPSPEETPSGHSKVEHGCYW